MSVRRRTRWKGSSGPGTEHVVSFASRGLFEILDLERLSSLLLLTCCWSHSRQCCWLQSRRHWGAAEAPTANIFHLLPASFDRPDIALVQILRVTRAPRLLSEQVHLTKRNRGLFPTVGNLHELYLPWPHELSSTVHEALPVESSHEAQVFYSSLPDL